MPGGFNQGLISGLLGGFTQAEQQKQQLQLSERSKDLDRYLRTATAEGLPDDMRDWALGQVQSIVQGKKPGAKGGGELSPVLQQLKKMLGMARGEQQGQQQPGQGGTPQQGEEIPAPADRMSPGGSVGIRRGAQPQRSPGGFTENLPNGQAAPGTSGSAPGAGFPSGGGQQAPPLGTRPTLKRQPDQDTANIGMPAGGGAMTTQPAPQSDAAPQGGGQRQQQPSQPQGDIFSRQLANIDQQIAQAKWPQTQRLQQQRAKIVDLQFSSEIARYESQQQDIDKSAAAKRERTTAVNEIKEAVKSGDLSDEEAHEAIAKMYGASPSAGAAEEKKVPGSALQGNDPRTGKPRQDAFGNPIDTKQNYTFGKDKKLYPEANPPDKPEKLSGELQTRAEANKILADPASSAELKAAAKATLKHLDTTERGGEVRIINQQASASQKSEVKDDARTIADAIANGTDAPDFAGLNRTGTGAKVRAILDRQGYNLMAAERDWKAVQRHLTTLNGAQQERLRQAITFASDSIPKLEDLYDQWTSTKLPGGFKDYNKAALVAASHLPGDAGVKAQTLLTQINDLTSEMGTVYKGGNSSTDESLKLAASNLSADWNPAQFKAAVDQLRKNLQIRQNSINTSTAAGVTPNSPYLPPQNGGQQQGDDQKPTRYANGPNGQRLGLVNGSWVPVKNGQ